MAAWTCLVYRLQMRLTADDIGKLVERADGKVIGVVTAVEQETAHVEPTHDVVDGIKARLGWEFGPEEPFSLEADAVEQRTETRLMLTAAFSPTTTQRATSHRRD